MKMFRPAIAVIGILALAGCHLARTETVTIHRDDFGVPNIFADSDEGVAFGAGYAQAEDRLEELLKQYRRAAGTMAEAFGPEHFRDDYRQRVWSHAAVSRAKYEEITPRTRGVIEAYLEGVKLFMRRHPEKVPSWAPELEPWMIAALGRYVIWGWPEGTAVDELHRAGIEVDPVEAHASNEWVVSGRRTECGAPIALVDPHLSWYGAFRFYEQRLYGKRLQVAGVTILGAPIPSLGHSRFASVAMTTGGPDTTDVYEITLDPSHPGKYLYDGEWRDILIRKEVIRVKKGDAIEDVPITLESTHHGPIVAHRDGKAYAVKIPYANEVTLSDQTYEMMTARSLGEIQDALRRLQLMEQNVMVATVKGDLYYVRNGRVPIRPQGAFDWSRPVPGSTSRTEWLGIHPLEDLVQVLNPPQGYMQNCNVSPAVMMVDSPLQKERFAAHPYLFNEENPYLHQRAAETRAELHAETRLSVARAIEIAHSTVVYNADRWQRMVGAAKDAEPGKKLGDDSAKLLQLILGWNGHADEESTGATAYFFWKEAVYKIPDEVPPAERIRGESRLGEAAKQRDRGGLEPPPVPAPELLAALELAAKRLRDGWGRIDVRYGEVFRIEREGSPRSFPIGGGSQAGMSTPRSVHYKADADGKTFHGTGGQTSTQIVVLTDPPQSYSLLPLGESDDPSSPYFDDQAEKLMQKRTLKPTYFLQKAELLKHVTATTVLERQR